MSLMKRAIEGIVVAGSLVMMISIADTAGMLALEAQAGAKTDLATNGTAGVVVALDQIQAEALEDIQTVTADVEKTDTVLVTSAEVAEVQPAQNVQEEVSLTEEQMLWQNRLMADVDEFLYVRAAGDENAEIIGKLYKGDVAEIVAYGDTWTQVVSGNVEGYVKNSYCLFGADAMAYATSTFDTEAEIQTNGLRVRTGASEDASVIAAVSTGMSLTVDTSAEAVDGWVAVDYAGETGYVSADYVTTELDLGEAITIEEEQEELARIAEEKAAAASAQVSSSGTVQNSAVAASVSDVTLLAALIQCEAGNEPYEGQLAVGAVVMNRLKSGRYAGSIYDVIYQPGQFPPAGSGSVANIAAAGPKASCIQAAQQAINGMDNTGGALCFRRASSGQPGVVIGNHVFY